MSSPDFPEALALPFPSLLDEILAELAPRQLPLPPPIAGGAPDPWDPIGWLVDHVRDVWDRLISFPRHMVGWFWDRVTDTWDHINNYTRWIWDNFISPAFGAVRTFVGDTVGWLWQNLIEPAFGAVKTFVGNSLGWLWENLISPSLAWLKDRWDDFHHFFSDTVWPTIQSIPSMTVDVVMGGAQAIGAGFREALEWLFEHIFEPFADAIKTKMSIPRKLLLGQYRTPEEMLDDFEDPLPWGSVAQFALMVPGAILGLIGAASEAGSVIYEGKVQEAAKLAGHTIPTFTDLRDAYLREIMPESVHDDWLGRCGYSEDNIAIIKQLYYEIPTPSDLVRMAVREVFSPDVVERFGQMEDFPPDFAKYGEQIGISEEWAKAHWAAHWDLPSATQGFDMFHREVISHDDLALLLRALDVMPFWRDRLIQIAYRVISRVDVRRMYAHGVFNRDQVKRVYLHLGYTPEDAEALTEFVVRAAAGVEKGLPRATIEKAYQNRLLSRDDALDQLQDLDFTLEEAEMFLDMIDLRVEEELAGLAEDIVEADFRAGAISETETRAELRELGVPEARVDLLIQLWDRKKAVRTTTLTMSQVLRLLREEIINEATCRERLGALGYNEADINYLIQLSTPEAAAVEAAELTKADLLRALREETIDITECRHRLEVKGYAPADIDILTARETKELTASQIVSRFREGVLPEEEARQRLARAGYSEEDIGVLIYTAGRELTASQIVSRFRDGVVSEGEARERLRRAGYAEADIEVLIRPVARELSTSQIVAAFRDAVATEAETRDRLRGLDYSEEDINVLVQTAARELTTAQILAAFKKGVMTEATVRGRLQEALYSLEDIDTLIETNRPGEEGE